MHNIKKAGRKSECQAIYLILSKLDKYIKRKVDLVMKDGIAANKNVVRKGAMLKSARVIFSDKKMWPQLVVRPEEGK